MSVPRRILAAVALAAALLVLPAAAGAATRPSASTGSAASVSDQAATLNASVNPRGRATTWIFQYGPTIAYGSATAAQSAGSGTTTRHVATAIAALTPFTRYHYRVVAHSSAGTTLGADRTFRTDKQPLGFQIGATPNPVLFGRSTTVSGTLTGTGGGNRDVVLQQRPFPYTAAWTQVGNPLITAATGAFAFAGVPVALNTQFRVRTRNGASVTSPVVTAGVAVRVSTRVSRTTVSRGGVVRFSGHVKPARDGAQVGVQKRNAKGRWVTIAGTVARHASATQSRYAKRVHIRRGGRYRIFVLITDGNYVSNVGRELTLHTR